MAGQKTMLVVTVTGLLMAMAVTDLHRAASKTIRRRSINNQWSSWRSQPPNRHPFLNGYPSSMYSELCLSRDGLAGLCRNVHNCSFVIETALHFQITVCAWSSLVPVVCCPLRSPQEATALINSIFSHQPTTTSSSTANYYHRPQPYRPLYHQRPPMPINAQYHNQQLNSISAVSTNGHRHSSEALEQIATSVAITSQLKTKPNATANEPPKEDDLSKPQNISIGNENGSLVFSVNKPNNDPGPSLPATPTQKTNKTEPRCGLPSYNVVESRRLARSPVLHRPNSKYPSHMFHDTSMIVGGKMAAVGSFPWMAAIYKSVRLAGTYRSNFLCAGSIVDRWHVITAAHCFDKRDDLSVFIVRVGDQDLPTTPLVDIGSEIGDIRIDKLTFHPDYLPPQVYNDLAIIRLSKPVPLDTGRYLPICLPPQTTDNSSFANLTGNEATVTGWGATGTGRPASSVLQQVTLPILPNVRCDQAYGHVLGMAIYFPRGISEDMLCAGYENGGKDACQGDSGGPLMVLDEDGRWTLVGIVSVGRGCAEPGYPGLYTRITQYIPWIKNTTANP